MVTIISENGNSREKLAIRVSINTIIINSILTVIKALAGFFGNSGAMLSDAVHTLSDVMTTIIVIIGIKISSKESDDGHQYGHERLESVAAILLSVILFLTGAAIGWSGIEKIIYGEYEALAIPGLSALAAAVGSVAVKEAMYWYTRAAAKKTGSGALLADAWHHRSDALSSIGSFIGILGARLGAPVLDPLASVIICVFVLKAAIAIFRDAITKMTDTSGDEDTVAKINEIILGQPGVISVDLLKTRVFGERIYVDVEISADGNSTLNEAHTVAECVHEAIERSVPSVKHCMVHVNPSGREMAGNNGTQPEE